MKDCIFAMLKILILQNIDDEFNEVFLVGHNPSLMELGELLSSLCLASFPTSSILCLEFDIKEFKNLKHMEN